MKTTTTKTPGATNPDAIAMLTADHKAVQEMFKDFAKLGQNGGSVDEKAELVTRACRELAIHAQIEEEIFYPAVRDAIKDDDLMDEAEVEHASAKDLISQLEAMEPADDLYNARFTVLGEYINHHVKEEQDEMFPKAKKAKLDLKALGEDLAQRKKELRADLGMDDTDLEDREAEIAEQPRRAVGQAGGRR
jgi:hemerythrin superfamily protein